MSKIDYSLLDGRALRTFLTVFEEMSVSKAAEQLGVTQSAVSHTLDKLRNALGDPLFVRSGRGILPTERARELREPIQVVLDNLKALADGRHFDPKLEPLKFTVAANDLARVLLFPPLLRELDEEEIDARFRFLPSGIPTANLLGEARCQLMVTPLPPHGNDIFQQLLFRDRFVCFFDANQRDAPKTWAEYAECDYVDVRFPDNNRALQALKSINTSYLTKPKVTVPGFGDLASFIKGTRMITTQLSVQKLWLFKGFGRSELPFDHSPVKVYLVWHRRDHTDPAHKWLRNKILDTASGLQRHL